MIDKDIDEILKNKKKYEIGEIISALCYKYGINTDTMMCFEDCQNIIY